MSRNKPEFHIARIQADGTQEEPQVVSVTAMPWDTKMDRRGALGVGLGAAAVLAWIDRADAAQQRPPQGTKPAMPQTPQPVLKAHGARVSALVSVSGGRILASSSDDNTIKLWSPADARLIATLTGHTDDVTAIAASPDGSVLASASRDGSIRLWSPADGRFVGVVAGHEQPVQSLAFAADGRILASGSEDRTIRLWAIPDGRLVGTLEGHTGSVRALALASDQRTTLISASDDMTVRLWAFPSGQPVKTLDGQLRNVTQLSVSGDRFASGSDNGIVKVWSAAEALPVTTIEAHKGPIRSLHLDVPRGFVATGSDDSTIKLWSLADGSLKGEMKATTSVSSLTATPQGLISGDRSGAIALWDLSPERFKAYLQDPVLAAPALANRLRAHTAGVTELALASDGKTLVSASRDKSLKIWSIPEGTLVSRLDGHTDAVTSLALHPDGRTIVSASTDKTIVLWSIGDVPPAPTPARPARGGKPSPPPRVRAGKIERKLEGHTAEVTALALSLDGQTLVSAARDRSVRTWTLPAGTAGAVLTLPSAVGRGLAMSRDGQTIAAAGTDAVRTWSGGNLIAVMKPAGFGTMRDASLAISPDNRLLAAGDASVGLTLWSLADGKRIPMKSRHPAVTHVRFTREGNRIVSGGNDGALCLWSLPDGELLARYEGNSDGNSTSVSAIAISSDGKLMAAGFADGGVGLWALPTGQMLASFKGQMFSSVAAMAMTPDAKWLATGDASGTITLWDLERRAFHGFLFDPTANDSNTKGTSYNVFDKITGQMITYTLPCGSPIPPGAVCTCNCVPGTAAVPRPTGGGGGGGTYCRCNKICTCVPISSRRWKTNIEPLNEALRAVMRLNGVRYDWTPDAPQGRHGRDIGFIAEDVAPIVPEVVAVDEHGNPSGVDYARLTVLLVEALKTQQQAIEELRECLAEVQSAASVR